MMMILTLLSRRVFILVNNLQAHHKPTLQDDPAYAQLENIQDHPLGMKILQTIALQLRGNESLSAVSKLLNDLRSDLEVTIYIIILGKIN
jgi:hypothetical protein